MGDDPAAGTVSLSLSRLLRAPLPPSAVALVIANLAPLAGVIALGWDVGDLMILYWLENVIVGFYFILRIAFARPDVPGLWLGKLFLIPFFVVHFGGFTYVHGLFVLAIFGGSRTGFAMSAGGVAEIVTERALWFAMIFLFLSHGFSFVWNYLRGGEYRSTNTEMQKIFMAPYSRVVLLHLTLIFGAIPTLLLGSPLGALILLLVLKIGADMRAHLQEHAIP